MDLLLPPDFKEFLRLLDAERVEYLLVGAYAVSYYGYPRPTGDLDVWVGRNIDTAAKLVQVLRQFGFAEGVSSELFLTPDRVVRMGVPPVRIEVLSSISGVEFPECYARRLETALDGTSVSLIGRDDLIANKIAAGRPKDLNDLMQLGYTKLD